MKCKVLDEGLLRGALGGPESAADEEIEEERGVLAEVDERLRKASACSTSVSEFLADEGEVAATLDTIDGVSRLLGALRRASRGLSRDLSQARVDLLRSAEALVDAKGTTSAVEEEKDGASLSLPQDVWRPFVQSGEKTTTNVTEKMGKRLWSEESMQEVTSCALRRSRLHSLLRLLVQDHERELEVAQLRQAVKTIEEDLLDLVISQVSGKPPADRSGNADDGNQSKESLF